MHLGELFDEASGMLGPGAVLDVSEEKRSEQRLRESEARLQAAVDLLNLGLYSWDPVTNELHWDEKVKAMWGLPPETSIDWDIARAGVHPDDRARVDAAVAACTDPGGDGIYDVEYRVIGRDGVERWIATRGQTSFNEGRPVSFEGVVIDVTNRKLVESTLERLVELRTRELERANASLQTGAEERHRVDQRLDHLQVELYHASRLSVAGQMAAMIAHELSQPLAAVVNSVNAIRRLLASHVPGAEASVRELTEDVSVQAERAHQIVRRLRHFIRRGSPDRVPELVKPLVEEAVAFASVGPDGLGVTTSCYFDPLVSAVVVDRVQIQQVIANLVRNSLQAMRDQPRREITIATRGSGEGMLEVTVTDSGPGVEDKFRKKLFEDFQSTKPGGMGLGLSISRSIVEAHGGKIHYEPAFGGGATFSFTVPVALEPVA